MPSRVRTTAQAQGLQRCSTHGCRCCDRQGRTFSDHTAYVERWHVIGDDERPNFGWRAYGFDGPAMLRDERVIEDRYAMVCAKHKSATGVFCKWLPALGTQEQSTQMIRVVMRPRPAQQSYEQWDTHDRFVVGVLSLVGAESL